MVPEWELWACANHYVTQHGADAAVIAALRCDELLEAGDMEGVRTYQAIIRRIHELQAAPAAPLH